MDLPGRVTNSNTWRRWNSKRCVAKNRENKRRSEIAEPQVWFEGENCRSLPLVGMTRGVRLRTGELATWMDGVPNRSFAKTAGPSTTLRSGRDDKGRGVTYRGVSDLDVSNLYFARTAGSEQR